MGKRKRPFVPGETVTFRLRKDDQEIADYLNSLQNPADQIIEGIRMRKSAEPNYDTQKAEEIDISALLLAIEDIVQRSVAKAFQESMKQELIPQIQQIMHTVIMNMELVRKDTINEQAVAIEVAQEISENDEDVGEALDSLANW